jgi:hypothetical protein
MYIIRTTNRTRYVLLKFTVYTDLISGQRDNVSDGDRTASSPRIRVDRARFVGESESATGTVPYGIRYVVPIVCQEHTARPVRARTCQWPCQDAT